MKVIAKRRYGHALQQAQLVQLSITVGVGAMFVLFFVKLKNRNFWISRVGTRR